MSSNRPNRLRLFTEADYGARSAYGKPLHGWTQNGVTDPDVGQLHGFINDMGFALMHVVNQADDGAGGWKNLYDQFVLFENPGAIVVCTDGSGRVGLVPVFRLVGDRLHEVLKLLKNPDTGKYDFSAYAKTLRDKQLFAKAVGALGEHVWELPRGLAPAGETADLEAFIRKVAAIEAKEEAGFDVADVRMRGKVNANTTFFPHAQFVVSATIVGVGDSEPEAMESIGKVRMFTPEQLRRMADDDQLFDGLTLACLAKVGYRF